MNILFTICGRAGSKGIKNKNIRDFNGTPLVYYTLSAIDLYMKAHNENECHVALNTDSKELIDIINKYDKLQIAYVPRKKDLAGDRVAKRDVIIDTLKQMKNDNNCIYDMVIDLDITSPLRTLKDVENAIDKFIETKADVVFSVTTSRRNPYFNMVKKTENGYEKVLEMDIVSRQQAPDVFDMNASIYVYKEAHLLAGHGDLEGYNEVIMMEDTGVLDLDHEGDFALMQVIAEYFANTNGDFAEIRNNAFIDER